MLGSVLAKSFRDQRLSIFGWSATIAVLILAIVLLWPAFEATMAELARFMTDMPAAFQAMMGGADIATARGFISVELFSYVLPVLVAILAIGKGAGMLAGEEERGDLELVLVRPVPRLKLALEKIVALTGTIAIVIAVALAAALAGIGAVDLDVSTAEMARAMLGLGLLGWFFGAIAFGVGAATGRKIIAIGAAAAVAGISYLAATFGPIISGLDWLADISPWYWAFGEDPIANGLGIGGAALLIGLSLAALAVGTYLFTRRDIR